MRVALALLAMVVLSFAIDLLLTIPLAEILRLTGMYETPMPRFALSFVASVGSVFFAVRLMRTLFRTYPIAWVASLYIVLCAVIILADFCWPALPRDGSFWRQIIDYSVSGIAAAIFSGKKRRCGGHHQDSLHRAFDAWQGKRLVKPMSSYPGQAG